MRVVGEAGGGAVRVVAGGDLSILSVEMSPALAAGLGPVKVNAVVIRWFDHAREVAAGGMARHHDALAEALPQEQAGGAQLVDEIVDYQNTYRLCYIRGPEGILIGLAEEL